MKRLVPSLPTTTLNLPRLLKQLTLNANFCRQPGALERTSRLCGTQSDPVAQALPAPRGRDRFLCRPEEAVPSIPRGGHSSGPGAGKRSVRDPGPQRSLFPPP